MRNKTFFWISLSLMSTILSPYATADENAIVYENGDNPQWKKYDGDYDKSKAITTYDEELQSNIVKLIEIPTSRTTGFKLGDSHGDGAWHNPNTWISWKMKYSENFVFYIGVETTNGYKYLKYSNHDSDYNPEIIKTTIHHGLGSIRKNGMWQTITRDLKKDLKKYDKYNEIISVNEFKVLGSGMLDDIEVFYSNHDITDQFIKKTEDEKSKKTTITNENIIINNNEIYTIEFEIKLPKKNDKDNSSIYSGGYIELALYERSLRHKIGEPTNVMVPLDGEFHKIVFSKKININHSGKGLFFQLIPRSVKYNDNKNIAATDFEIQNIKIYKNNIPSPSVSDSNRDYFDGQVKIGKTGLWEIDNEKIFPFFIYFDQGGIPKESSVEKRLNLYKETYGITGVVASAWGYPIKDFETRDLSKLSDEDKALFLDETYSTFKRYIKADMKVVMNTTDIYSAYLNYINASDLVKKSKYKQYYNNSILALKIVMTTAEKGVNDKALQIRNNIVAWNWDNEVYRNKGATNDTYDKFYKWLREEIDPNKMFPIVMLNGNYGVTPLFEKYYDYTGHYAAHDPISEGVVVKWDGYVVLKTPTSLVGNEAINLITDDFLNDHRTLKKDKEDSMEHLIQSKSTKHFTVDLDYALGDGVICKFKLGDKYIDLISDSNINESFQELKGSYFSEGKYNIKSKEKYTAEEIRNLSIEVNVENIKHEYSNTEWAAYPQSSMRDIYAMTTKPVGLAEINIGSGRYFGSTLFASIANGATSLFIWKDQGVKESSWNWKYNRNLNFTSLTDASETKKLRIKIDELINEGVFDGNFNTSFSLEPANGFTPSYREVIGTREGADNTMYIIAANVTGEEKEFQFKIKNSLYSDAYGLSTVAESHSSISSSLVNGVIKLTMPANSYICTEVIK